MQKNSKIWRLILIVDSEVLKRLNEQQTLLNNLQKQVGESNQHMTSLLEQISQTVPTKDITLVSYGSILVCFFSFILLFLLTAFRDVPRWKKLGMKKPYIVALTHCFNASLLITGIVMIASAFWKLSLNKDPLFFSIFTVMGSILLSVGLALGLSNQQKIEKAEDDANLVTEIRNLIKGRKIKNSSDIQSLRDMEAQLKSLLKDLKNNKATDTNKILQQEINRISNILKEYKE